MGWQPIETAPINVRVQLGWYEDYNYGNGPKWQTRADVGRSQTRVQRIFGVFTYEREDASHWRPLPAPPAD